MEMDTTTVEIPRERWIDFFNDVGRLYHGWATTVEVLEGELGDQPVAEGLPLQGISYEPAGSMAGSILVEVGDIEPAFEVHRIERPRAVRMTPAIPGVETDIQIESEDDTATIVRMHVRPELPPPGSA